MRLRALVGAWSALNGAVAVGAGAFAAHGVDAPRAVELLATGSRWHAIAALAGLVCALADAPRPALAFALGGTIFSGTLYAMVAGAPSWLGAVTPIGGTLLIVGWLWLAVVLWRRWG